MKLATAKRIMGRIPEGHARQWYRCTKCHAYMCLDFVPRSLSNPVLIPSCGHDMRELDEVGTWHRAKKRVREAKTR